MLLLLATLTFPFQVTLVPLFLLMLRIGWMDNYLAIIVPGAISAFGAFFMRQTMLGVPNELLDAARIDGASDSGYLLAHRPAPGRAGRCRYWRCWSSWDRGTTTCGP